MKIIEINEDNKNYPYLLHQISSKPKKLYVLGELSNLNKRCITVVGARCATSYGMKMSEHIANIFAKMDFVIVSGLAKGIDTSAHLGALKAKGRTIAVLAHGLNHIYPKENRNLAIQILNNNGTLISEYPINTKIKKEAFVGRNRIISGLSEATIVVEAKEKSGSLITADFALNQGREVYAVPGDIDNQYSKGTNKLIQDGAKIFIL